MSMLEQMTDEELNAAIARAHATLDMYVREYNRRHTRPLDEHGEPIPGARPSPRGWPSER